MKRHRQSSAEICAGFVGAGWKTVPSSSKPWINAKGTIPNPAAMNTKYPVGIRHGSTRLELVRVPLALMCALRLDGAGWKTAPTEQSNSAD